MAATTGKEGFSIGRCIRTLLVSALFAALAIAAVVRYVDQMARPPYHAPEKTTERAPRGPVFAALEPEAIGETYETIASFGSRAPGQPGLEKAREYILSRFKEIGLETYEQNVDLAYPLLSEGSGFISNSTFRADVWPFRPNWIQPATTGPDGLDGELLLADSASMRSCTDFKGKIAVIDLGGEVFGEFGLSPSRYAEVGFAAIIYTHRDGLERFPWDTIGDKAIIHRLPVNVVRVACGPEVLSHIGERVHVDCVSTWHNARTKNVVGVLRAPNPEGRALFMTVQYDAMSHLPDLAYGSIEAYQAALLVHSAEALASMRPYLKRDVVFAATTGISKEMFGMNRFLATIGVNGKRDFVATHLAEEVARDNARAAMLAEIAALFDDPLFMVFGHAAETDAAIHTLSPATRKFLAERFSASVRTSVFDQAERLLQARIAYQRHPDDLDSPDYLAFRAEKTLHDDLANLCALPLAKAIERPLSAREVFSSADGKRVNLRESFRADVERLRAWHRVRHEDLAADVALQDIFFKYNDIFALSGRFAPTIRPGAVEKLGVTPGREVVKGEFFELFRAIVNESAFRLGMHDKVQVSETDSYAYYNLYTADLDALPFCACSWPAGQIVGAGEPAHRSDYPLRQEEFGRMADTCRHSLRVFADTAASIAESAASFPSPPARDALGARGIVYCAGIGNSVVPNYPVENALICCWDKKTPLITDPYGEYDIPLHVMPAGPGERWRRYEAFRFDEWGRLTHAKDYGDATQKIYFSAGTMEWNYVPVKHVLFRGQPVTILGGVNPQSLKSYTAYSFLKTRGLSEFPTTCRFKTGDGYIDFLPPDSRFFLALKAGSAQNELVSAIRAFCLGTAHSDDPAYHPTDNEIDGPGYLANDTAILQDLTSEAITSMSWLSDKRLDLQRAYGMADELTDEFAAKAAKIASSPSAAPSHPILERERSLRQALAYLILNHPVISDSIKEAVMGILWYLGLLVPFTFFFEKLVFGFTDIRRQILAQGATFLIVFALLRVLHPAFHMIRSSGMILLGFVIVIIVGSVLAVLLDKFKEAFDALRRSQGHVAGAEGDKAGIVMTAFLLGLNNMHRRKVRTGLTCATLVLMTFVMICFTSVRSNVVESERAVGRAGYQGIVVRGKDFAPLSPAEIDALKSTFGGRHTVSRRSMYAGMFDFNLMSLRPAQFSVAYGEGDSARVRVARGGIGFDHTEPLAGSLTLLCTNGWFTAEDSRLASPPYPVIIPDLMAQSLGITKEMVESGPVDVTINGGRFVVRNIFDSQSLAALTDADGHDILPFDVETIVNTQMAPGEFVIAEEDDGRVDPAETILVPNDRLASDYRMVRPASAVVDMGNVPYSTARDEITDYMEQSGRECHYALDGTAFVGRRARTRTAAGLIDLLIPLVIAALTVLNTMKGSVYERQNEIYVYNAVGIAPRYIFFMFIAEALVYSVVGAVLGYILSQGVGRILSAFNLTGGMNMNFTSATCVYASLAIAAATLLSTWFPARTAMEIAKPADNAGWSLPSPDADGRLTIILPFTFSHRDRIAVLAFLHRFFDSFGEGSAGSFFASEPELMISDKLDALADGAYVPALSARIWLKPFDLGVSQDMEIDLGTDPETHEYIARMTLTRLTGTLDAWLRLNRPFVAAIRQQFLHWRAVGEEQKTELFAEAKGLLEASASFAAQ